MGLRHLLGDSYGCKALSDVPALGAGLAALRELRHRVLDFYGRKALSGISAQGAGLAALRGLRHLKLDLMPVVTRYSAAISVCELYRL